MGTPNYVMSAKLKKIKNITKVWANTQQSIQIIIVKCVDELNVTTTPLARDPSVTVLLNKRELLK